MRTNSKEKQLSRPICIYMRSRPIFLICFLFCYFFVAGIGYIYFGKGRFAYSIRSTSWAQTYLVEPLDYLLGLDGIRGETLALVEDVSMGGDVRVKAPQNLVYQTSGQGAQLEGGSLVSTGNESEAIIALLENDYRVIMKPNSTLFIERRKKRGARGDEYEIDLKVLSGSAKLEELSPEEKAERQKMRAERSRRQIERRIASEMATAEKQLAVAEKAQDAKAQAAAEAAARALKAEEEALAAATQTLQDSKVTLTNFEDQTMTVADAGKDPEASKLAQDLQSLQDASEGLEVAKEEEKLEALPEDPKVEGSVETLFSPKMNLAEENVPAPAAPRRRYRAPGPVPGENFAITRAISRRLTRAPASFRQYDLESMALAMNKSRPMGRSPARSKKEFSYAIAEVSTLYMEHFLASRSCTKAKETLLNVKDNFDSNNQKDEWVKTWEQKLGSNPACKNMR